MAYGSVSIGGNGYSLPPASKTSLGGVVIGTGMGVSSNGTISVTVDKNLNTDGVAADAKTVGTKINALSTTVSGKANSSHTHDDRYYTESEIDTKLSGKAASDHTHDGRYLLANGKAANAIYADSAGSAGNVNGLSFVTQTTDPGAGSDLTTNKVLIVYV